MFGSSVFKEMLLVGPEFFPHPSSKRDIPTQMCEGGTQESIAEPVIRCTPKNRVHSGWKGPFEGD